MLSLSNLLVIGLAVLAQDMPASYVTLTPPGVRDFSDSAGYRLGSRRFCHCAVTLEDPWRWA